MTPLTLVWEADETDASLVRCRHGDRQYDVFEVHSFGWLARVYVDPFVVYLDDHIQPTRELALAAATRHAATGRWAE